MDDDQYNKILKYQDGMNKSNINFRTVRAPPTNLDSNLRKDRLNNIALYIDAHITAIKEPTYFNHATEQHCFYRLVKNIGRENHFKALIRTEFPNDNILKALYQPKDIVSVAIEGLFTILGSQKENLEQKNRDIELNRIYKILYCSDFFDDDDIDNIMTI